MSERDKARREAFEFGRKSIEAVKAGDADKAGALAMLAMFAVRWAKRAKCAARDDRDFRRAFTPNRHGEYA